jgi:hypothetical protein
MWLTSLSPASYLEKVDQFGGGGPFDGELRYLRNDLVVLIEKMKVTLIVSKIVT